VVEVDAVKVARILRSWHSVEDWEVAEEEGIAATFISY
jgi:hypothetical protein